MSMENPSAPEPLKTAAELAMERADELIRADNEAAEAAAAAEVTPAEITPAEVAPEPAQDWLKTSEQIAMERADKLVSEEKAAAEAAAAATAEVAPEPVKDWLKTSVELAMEKTDKYVTPAAPETPPATPPAPDTAPAAPGTPPAAPTAPGTPPAAPTAPGTPPTAPTAPGTPPAAPEVPPGAFLASLNLENQGFFGRMSERAKNVTNAVYEGLYKMPGVSRLVGKLEIGYNKFWVDRHEKKAVRLKTKMDVLDMRAGAQDKSRKEIEALAEDLKNRKIPGAEALLLKAKGLEEKRAGALNKKDKLQSKLESRENKMKLHTNERDRIADKLINRYNEKLEPLENVLARHETCKLRIDLEAAVVKAEHSEQLAELDAIKKRKTQMEETMRTAGMSDGEIKSTLKPLDDVITDGQEKIRKEEEVLGQRKAEINAKIAKAAKKANPYIDKRNEFKRVKDRRPVKIDADKKTILRGFEGEEEMTVGRTEDESETPEAGGANLAEAGTEDGERIRISDFIASWNDFITRRNNGAVYGDPVDLRDFLGETRRLSENSQMRPKDFKKVLGAYYNLKKSPIKDNVGRNFDEFIRGQATN